MECRSGAVKGVALAVPRPTSAVEGLDVNDETACAQNQGKDEKLSSKGTAGLQAAMSEKTRGKRMRRQGVRINDDAGQHRLIIVDAPTRGLIRKRFEAPTECFPASTLTVKRVTSPAMSTTYRAMHEIPCDSTQ